LSISNTNVKVWVNVIPIHSIVIIHCIHQQNKFFHHILKCVDIALPSSKNTFPCCEIEFIGNIWIYNPMLHYLYPLKEIFTMRTTKKIIPTPKWQILHYSGYGMGNTFIYHNKKSLCPMEYVKFHAIWKSLFTNLKLLYINYLN